MQTTSLGLSSLLKSTRKIIAVTKKLLLELREPLEVR